MNLRHPVQRLESAFYMHGWFAKCRGNHNLEYCLHNTTLFSKGMHRNKVVKELSGFYAPTEFGGCLGELVDNQLPVEATREDLEVAKLVLARFLPPVVFDTHDLLQKTLHTTAYQPI